ncbi:MAG: S41 family peptidase [Planctomycetota bacterium]|nr:S41 family peptidase [Planctomycetota bacterium]
MKRGLLIPVLTILLLAGCRSYDPDIFDARLRSATFETYHEAIVESYPDLDRVGLDAQTLRDRWELAVVEAGSATEYYHALGEMCAALDDPHLRLTPNYDLWSQTDGQLGATDLRIAMVDGQPRLWNQFHDYALDFTDESFEDIWPDHQEDNLNGWLVESFNGISPDKDVIEDVLNIGPHGTIVEVDLSSPDESSQLTLKRRRGLNVMIKSPREIDTSNIGSSLFRDATTSTLNAIKERAWEAETSKFHDGNYLFAWRVDDWGGLVWKTSDTLPGREDIAELEEDLKAAAEILDGTSCTLLDFRYQGGGNGVGFLAMMENLLPTKVDLTAEREWLFFRIRGILRIEESPSIMRGPVIILVNEFTASYGEWMTSLIRRECNATVLGSRTGGCEYCIVNIEGPDGSKLRFGGEPYTRTEGIPPFQSVGLTPDQQITMDPADLKSGSMAKALLSTHERQTRTAWLLLEDLCDEAIP